MYLFEFENKIIEIVQDGIVDIKFLDNYLLIKDLYNKYVDFRITFFDIKRSNKIDHFETNEMEANHITTCHAGGKITSDNCQMLCRKCNRRKSGIYLYNSSFFMV